MRTDVPQGPDHRDTPPLISVVITNYNYGAFIGQAIESVLAQTYPRVECVVVDDGSTDDSREVIARYPAVRAVLKANGGQASAARAGVAAASGSILMFLDSDDWLKPEACARVAQAWREGAAAVFFALAVTRSGETVGRLPNEPFLAEGHLDYVRRWGYLPASPTSGNAFARGFVEALFETAVGMDRNCFDAYLLFSAPVWGDIVTLDEELGFYRIHEQNISLVNSTSVPRLAAHIYHMYWAQQTLSLMLRRRGLDANTWARIRGPYHVRWYLMTRDFRIPRYALPAVPAWRAALGGIWDTLRWPNMRPKQRLTSITLMIAFVVLPRPLRVSVAEFLNL